MAGNLDSYVELLPSADELRNRLAVNLHERDLLKRLLKLSQDREKLQRDKREGEGRADG